MTCLSLYPVIGFSSPSPVCLLSSCRHCYSLCEVLEGGDDSSLLAGHPTSLWRVLRRLLCPLLWTHWRGCITCVPLLTLEELGAAETTTSTRICAKLWADEPQREARQPTDLGCHGVHMKLAFYYVRPLVQPAQYCPLHRAAAPQGLGEKIFPSPEILRAGNAQSLTWELLHAKHVLYH